MGSYLPALIASLIYAATCKKPELPKFDPSLYTFNRPDAAETMKILQIVGQIQANVDKLQQVNQGGGADSMSQGETARQLQETQVYL